MYFCFIAFAICNLTFFVEARLIKFDFNSNVVNVRSAAENCHEFELGETTTIGGVPLLLPPCSTLPDQGKTKVLPVLHTTVPLNVTNQSPASNRGNYRILLSCPRF